MVPVHGLPTPAGTSLAHPQLRHGTEKRLAGKWVDLSGVGRIGIEECELVGREIVLERKCQVPANPPAHLKIGSQLNVVLEIWSNVGVAQVGIACTTSCAHSCIAEEEARKAISGSGASGITGLCRYVGREGDDSRATRLAPGSATFEIILVGRPNVHTRIHGVPARYVEQVTQVRVPFFVIDGRRQAVSGSPTVLKRLPPAAAKTNAWKNIGLPRETRRQSPSELSREQMRGKEIIALENVHKPAGYHQ